MLPFTPKERQAVIFTTCVFLAGLSFKLSFFLRPSLTGRLTILDEPQYRPRVNINRASYDEVLAVPHIGPSTAGKIIRYRQARGGIHNTEQLAEALGGKTASADKLAPYLEWR